MAIEAAVKVGERRGEAEAWVRAGVPGGSHAQRSAKNIPRGVSVESRDQLNSRVSLEATMRWRTRVWVNLTAIACMTLAGCGHSATDEGAAATPATGTASGKTVDLSAGFDLAMVQNTGQVHPLFRLAPPETETAIIFAKTKRMDNGQERNGALILRREGNPATLPTGARTSGWRILELMDAPNQEWVFATACPSRKEIWGVLDNAGDDRGDQLTLMRSGDGGRTWTYFSAVKKPSSEAICESLVLTDTGAGRLTMFMSTEEPDGRIRGHYYHYRTADGARTWTGPTIEPSDTTDADQCGTDDTLEEAIKDTQ